MSRTSACSATKRSVSEQTKKMVASSQRWACALCGCMLDFCYEVDHRVGLYRGGTNELDNLQALCASCHRRKTVAEHREHLELQEARQQLRLRFAEEPEQLAPLELVRHVMCSAFGWRPEQAEDRLRRLGIPVSDAEMGFPAMFWRARFEAAGCPMAERGRSVGGLRMLELRKPVFEKKRELNKPVVAEKTNLLFEEYRFTHTR